MQLTITNKLAIFAATIAVAFGMSLTAFAASNLEIEIDIYDNGSIAKVSYEEDGDDVTKTYTLEETDEDDIYAELADLLDMDVDDIEEASEVSEEDGDVPADSEEAEEAIADAEDAIEDAADWISKLDDEETEKEASTTLAEAEDLLAEAKDAFDDEDYQKAQDLAEEAEELAEGIHMSGEEDDDEDEDRKDDFCKRTAKAAGWGVAKKCSDDDDYELNEKVVKKVERFQDRNMEKYREYGKSGDKVVLQNQLQELLLLLISLLQKQMALQTTGS